MYKRDIIDLLLEFARGYPVIGVTGPPQVGKTTLVRSLFNHLPYVPLENLDIRLQAQNDPRGFLKKYTEDAIFDEIQYAPDIASYLQEIVDSSRVMGRYVITGSQNFVVSMQVSQSLAGRAGMTTPLPLRLSELPDHRDLDEYIFKGGFPAIYDRNLDPIKFFPAYVQTYIERDLRQLTKVEDLGTFQKFFKLCAGRIGQILNLDSLAQDCAISHATAKKWLNLLQASYLVFLLPPYHKNFNKRLTKQPKLYFYDTGIACSLLGIEQKEQLETHYLSGALFENVVILELLKGRFNQGLLPNLYFWRDQTGHEVDCIAEWGGIVRAIEVKSTSTLKADFLRNIKYFLSIFDIPQKTKSYLVYH